MTSSDKTTSQSSPAAAARTENASGPGTTVILQSSTPSLVQRIVSGLGWAGFILCAITLISMNLRLSDYFNTTSGLTEKFVSGEKYGKDKIAIITISGVIMEGDGFVKKQIDRVKEDKNVKAIFLRVDSPGGTVTGSDYMLHHLNKLRTEKKIPIVSAWEALRPAADTTWP